MTLDEATVRIIMNDPDLIFTHNGPNHHGKYSGWIFTTLSPIKSIFNTAPDFDTAEEAEQYLRDLREDLWQKTIKEVFACRNLKELLDGLKANSSITPSYL